MADEFDMKSLVDNALSSLEIEDDGNDTGGAFAVDPLETDNPNWKGHKYWTLDRGERIIKMDFKKFFGKESEYYDEFITSCQQKKAFSKMSNMFCNTANVILNKNKQVTEKFLYKYYCIKIKIDNGGFEDGNINFTPFINAIINLFDVDFLNEIRKYVNSKYKESGDDKWEENKRSFVPSITFLDRHIKVLYVVSRMIHFIVPLCLEYMREYKEVDAKEFLALVFTNLFPIAEAVGPEFVPLSKNHEEYTDVYEKLYSFVESKVNPTLKSDKTMWDRQVFLGINSRNIIEKIVNKLIVDIVPEYSFCGNCIHMNVAVCRKSIQDDVMRKKDPFSINCLIDMDSSVSDDDNAVVTEAEQFDNYNSKHDEFSIVIRHTFSEDTVNKILMRKGIIIDPAEYNWYLEHVKYHEFQTFVIFSAFVRYFGGSENMYSITKIHYVKLMIAISKMMEANGLTTLARYVTASKNRHYISRKETRVSKNAITQDTMYQHLLETKYKYVKNVLTRKNGFIESRIISLLNNEFTYNCPNELLNGKIIPRNEEEIRSEVLMFFNTFIY